jgi:predicted nucleotidyltransferase
MLNLYSVSRSESAVSGYSLTNSEKLSVLYHDIFDYPLSFAELIKWQVGKGIGGIKSSISITAKKGYYHVDSREGLIYKRQLRKRISAKKLKIAQKSAKILAMIPTVKMVAITGSLAMQNSTDDSDIDLLIVTKSETLWTTRLIVYTLLRATGYLLRKPRVKNERNALCLNIWLDEKDLVWKKADRNLYTAHEIAQIVPLVNKNKTYEMFLNENKWILNFWPNSVRISNMEHRIWKKNSKFNILNSIFSVVEKVLFWIQIKYMKPKMTREVATKTRALFHPQNWGEVVLSKLALYNEL